MEINDQRLHYVLSALMAEWIGPEDPSKGRVGPKVGATEIERIFTEARDLKIGDLSYVPGGGTDIDIPRNAFIREQMRRLGDVPVITRDVT